MPDLSPSPVSDQDVAELVVLQRCCWVTEAIANNTLDVPPLHETQAEVAEWCRTWNVWVVRQDHRLVGAVRAQQVGDVWDIGRLMVAPDLTGRGIGRQLLTYAESRASPETTQFRLFTGSASTRNIRMYEKAGYVITDDQMEAGHINGAVILIKNIRATSAV